ncbi:MAG: hypothetical protein QM796_04395 [Chthoniobacteraceae bacterium]
MKSSGKPSRRVADLINVRVEVSHPLAWLWEPLETEASFLLRPMFGSKAVYLEGRILFCFVTRDEEPWCGVLVCTDREHHESLRAEFATLTPHPVLPKWLYLSESVATFERDATRLVKLAQQRDPRLGVLPKPRKSSKKQRK